MGQGGSGSMGDSQLVHVVLHLFVHLQGHEPPLPASPTPTPAHLLLQLRLTLGAQLGHLSSTPLLLRHAVLRSSRQASAGQGEQTHSS